MSWVEELFSVIGNLRFCSTVYEFQQGLYFRFGKAKPVKIRWRGEALEQIVNEENKTKEIVGWRRNLPFFRAKLPEEYHYGFWTGRVRHNIRNEKDLNLQQGLYFFIPFIDNVITDSQQERVINLGTITVQTNEQDSQTMIISPNLRYKIENYYNTYTAVHDYEQSLRDYAISILAEHSRFLSFRDWCSSEKVTDLQKVVKKEIRDTTEDWGLNVMNIYITDSVKTDTHKLVTEGGLVNVLNNLKT